MDVLVACWRTQLDSLHLGKLVDGSNLFVGMPYKQAGSFIDKNFLLSSVLGEGEGELSIRAAQYIQKLKDMKLDAYWTPSIFVQTVEGERRRLAKRVVSGSVLWADLDEVDPRALTGISRPSVAYETSGGRFQGLWLLDFWLPREEIESLNRGIAEQVGADMSGWDIAQLLRIPETWHNKGEPVQGKLLWNTGQLFTREDIEDFPKSTPPAHAPTTGQKFQRINLELVTKKMGGATARLARLAYTQDRSAKMYSLAMRLREEGWEPQDVVNVLASLAYNKFEGRQDEEKQLWSLVSKVFETPLKVEEPGDFLTKLQHAGSIEFEGEAVGKAWFVPTLYHSKTEKSKWLIEDVLPNRSKLLIGGEYKTFKSRVVLDLAFSVATGANFLGEYPVLDPGDVVYFNGEVDEETMREWLRAIANSRRPEVLARGNRDTKLYLINVADVNLSSPKGEEFVELVLKNSKPRLVVFDPLYSFSGEANLNSADEVGRILQSLNKIKLEHDCGIVLVHHERKPQYTNTGREVTKRVQHKLAGSQVFTAWYEAYWSLRRKDEQQPIVEWERFFRSAKSIPTHELMFRLEYITEEMYQQDIIPDYGVEVVTPEDLKELSDADAEKKEHARRSERQKLARAFNLLLSQSSKDYVLRNELGDHLDWTKDKTGSIAQSLVERGALSTDTNGPQHARRYTIKNAGILNSVAKGEPDPVTVTIDFGQV